MYTKEEFAKINRVSVKDIDLLISLGILRPTIDSISHSEVFSSDQQTAVKKVLVFKEMGFSLDEIYQFITQTSHSDLRGLAQEMQQKFVKTIKHESQKLSEIDARISLLENWETIVTSNDVSLKSVAEQRVTSIREKIVKISDIKDIYEKLKSNLKTVARIRTSYPIIIYHDTEFNENNIDVEVAIPVNNVKIPTIGCAKTYSLSELKSVAFVKHEGNYALTKIAYAKIMLWVENNGFQIAGPHREVQLQENIDFESQEISIEIQIPIKQN